MNKGVNLYMANKVKKLMRKYWKDAFPILCAMISGFIAVCGWYINILAFSYNAARLSLYHVSTAYISDNSNTIFRIIYGVASGALILVSNYIVITFYRNISKKKWNILYIVVFILWEIVVIWCGIVFTAFSQPMNILWGFFKFDVGQKILIIILLLVCVLLINFCLVGELICKIMSVIRNCRKVSKKKEEIETEEVKEDKTEINIILNICTAAVISMALLLILTWVFGQSIERQNGGYKVIEANELIERNYVSDLDTKYYAVVFENQNVYIICPLHPLENSQDSNCEKKNNELESKEWYIDCDVTQEVNKNGIPTCYMSGIRHIDK